MFEFQYAKKCLDVFHRQKIPADELGFTHSKIHCKFDFHLSCNKIPKTTLLLVF